LGFLIAKMIEWNDESEAAAKVQEDLSKKVDLVTASLNRELESIDFAGKLRNEKLKQQGLSDAVVTERNLLTLKNKYAAYTDRI